VEIKMMQAPKKRQSWETVKDRFVLVAWLLAGLMLAVLGLLNLFRLHHLFFGVSYLAVAAGAFFIALRYKKKHFPRPVSRAL
jgi:hypothetical protein